MGGHVFPLEINFIRLHGWKYPLCILEFLLRGVVAFGSGRNWQSLGFSFCNKYNFNLYFRSQMSVTRHASRVRGFHFSFDFVCGRRCSLLSGCVGSVSARCRINKLCMKITFQVLCVTLCIHTAFQTDSWISMVSLCCLSLSYIIRNPRMCWLSEYVYGICAGNFHDILFL